MTLFVEELESCGNACGDLWDDPGGLSDGDPGDWVGVPAVTDVHVPVSLSSAVTETCEGVSLGPGWGSVELQSSSFSKEALVCLGGLSRRDKLGGVASESTTDVQKENDAAYVTTKVRIRRSRMCSGKAIWRYKEAVGTLVKERLLREWSST